MNRREDIKGFPGWGQKLIGPTDLNAIREAWESQAGKDEFHAEMDTVFAGIEGDLQRSAINNLYLVIYEHEMPQAILELIDSSRGVSTKLTKLLSLYPSPTYWDKPSPEMLEELYSSAILATIMIGSQENTKFSDYEVKIYGRNRELLDVLRHIDQNWQDTGNVNVSMKGHWLSLVIDPSK